MKPMSPQEQKKQDDAMQFYKGVFVGMILGVVAFAAFLKMLKP